MLFFSFFQSLVAKNVQITVELKNALQITGTLHSVDQYLNVKIDNVSINDPERYPHLNCFIRGSVVRYIHLNPSDIDTELLQDFCRKEAAQPSLQNKNKTKFSMLLNILLPKRHLVANTQSVLPPLTYRYFASSSNSTPQFTAEEINKNTNHFFGKESTDFSSSRKYNNNRDANLMGKVVHPPGAPREAIRSEMYGIKIQLEHGPRDRYLPAGTIGGEPSRWNQPHRDAPPQKFVNVNGQTFQLGVEPTPMDTRFWTAHRNTKWTKGLVNIPQWFRRRRVGVANYDYVMKTDYCMFWIPGFILFSLAVPSFALTYIQEELAYTAMTVKVIGRQWYWVFEVESPVDEDDGDDDE